MIWKWLDDISKIAYGYKYGYGVIYWQERAIKYKMKKEKLQEIERHFKENKNILNFYSLFKYYLDRGDEIIRS
ncbi:MAG: hypothetical protein B6I28_05140 [Fusobacteriia bacterium 4572_132]|nr:MAG: hypothetical protein B6I28_05140 [Fusobacteriia bacterium 4572_132]